MLVGNLTLLLPRTGVLRGRGAAVPASAGDLDEGSLVNGGKAAFVRVGNLT